MRVNEYDLQTTYPTRKNPCLTHRQNAWNRQRYEHISSSAGSKAAGYSARLTRSWVTLVLTTPYEGRGHQLSCCYRETDVAYRHDEIRQPTCVRQKIMGNGPEPCGSVNWPLLALLCCEVHFVAHDDVFKWKHFPRYWPFVRGIPRSPVNSPHIGQWRGALMFSLICAWINGWVNNREAGDLRRHRAHYDVTVMWCQSE